MDKIKPIETDVMVQAQAIRESSWSAVITHVSEVDAGGNMELVVDYQQDGKTVYPSITISGTPETILDSVKAKGGDLKAQQVQAIQIKVGDIVEI